MKYIFLLFIFFPFCCSAQTFEISLNGGFSIHSRPADNIHTTQDKPKAGYAADVKADLLLPHSQIGVGVTILSATEDNTLISPYTSSVKITLAQPLTTPYVFYNIIFPTVNSYWYAGISAGGAIARMGVNNYQEDANNKITGYTTTYNSVTGYVAGLQIGSVIKLSKRLGVNVEAAMRFTEYSYTDPTTAVADNPYHYRYFFFPFTAGLRYRI